MEHSENRLNARAAKAAFIPTLGLFGGLIVGAAWAALARATDLDLLRIIVKAALVGSFLGMGAATATAAGGWSTLTTTRGLARLVAITAVLFLIWASIP